MICSTVTDQRLEIRKCDGPTNGPTNGPTDLLTWVGARDTCVSKNRCCKFACRSSSSIQVTNGYEAYQMVAFGELAEWPAWAEVLSRCNIFLTKRLLAPLYTCYVHFLQMESLDAGHKRLNKHIHLCGQGEFFFWGNVTILIMILKNSFKC